MKTTYDYMRKFSRELGSRIVETYAPLQSATDPVAPELDQLLRSPFPAQSIAIMGVVKYFRKGGRSAKIVAECGAGKTFMALGAAHAHAAGKPYTMIEMCPPHLVKKWAREALTTVPGARAFIVNDLRNGGDQKMPHGVTEVRLINGEIVRKGLAFSLPELRKMGRKGFREQVNGRPCFFVMGKERGKLSYFWKPAYLVAKSGPELGGVVNPDTGRAIERNNDAGKLTALDFEDKVRQFEVANRGIASNGMKEPQDHRGTSAYSALWQADRNRIQRMAPLDFLGRYMKGFFDYAVADEVHQLAGDTAQGNGLAVLARASRWLMTLTGTMMGGYADDLFNVLYRCDGPKMAREGYEWGAQGRQDWQRTYGVIETVETVKEEENRCSRASKKTVQILRKPGSSPLLFGKHLMESTAFVSLEDISDQLPPYNEEVIQVKMDGKLARAYKKVEDSIRDVIKQYPKDKGLRSIMLNTLLAYPDYPFEWEKIVRKMIDHRTNNIVSVTVAKPENLDDGALYEKEARLVEEVRKELQQGRRCQVYVTYTGKHDAGQRVETVLKRAGFRVAVLRASVPTDQREAWYEKRLKEGVQVVVCHPRLVETGLDLLPFPTLIFYQSGYSTYTLRQASRRSWRIGQKLPIKVLFFAYQETMQEACLRLMGKKMLVSLMMEGKFSGEGLQAIDVDEDMLSAMARELVTKGGVGETADAVWRDIDRERTKHAPAPAPAPIHTEEAEPATETSDYPMPPAPDPVPTRTGSLDFDAKPEEPPAAAPEPAPVAIPAPPTPIPVPQPIQGSVLTLYALSPKRHTRSRVVIDEGQMSLFAAA